MTKRPDMLGNTHGFKKGQSPWNKGLTKETSSSVARISQSKVGVARPDMRGNTFKNGTRPWNYGKTKATDSLLSSMGQKHSATMKLLYSRGLTVWNEGLTKETDSRVKLVAEDSERRRKIGLAASNPSAATKRKKSLAGLLRWGALRDAGLIPPKEYENFTFELKELIREKYHRKCVDCGMPETSLKQRLSVHHVDGDKKNYAEANLIPLCRRCHGLREKELWHRFKAASFRHK